MDLPIAANYGIANIEKIHCPTNQSSKVLFFLLTIKHAIIANFSCWTAALRHIRSLGATLSR
jgi:hypothetical protein